MAFNNSSNISNIEFWYIPRDMLRIACNSATIGISFILLTIIASNKTCRTVPMMLSTNSCFAELICACVLLRMAIFVLQNDIKQIIYEDALCIFRGYLLISTTVVQNYSYVFQAIYRYITVVYPNYIFCQSVRFQLCLICTILKQ